MSKLPIMMAEEFWMNSQFSIARFYGGMVLNGVEYVIVNKEGITLRELSDPCSEYYVPEGKAIPPGEPVDLIREDWLPVYRGFKRDKTIELIERGCSLEEAKRLLKERHNEKEVSD